MKRIVLGLFIFTLSFIPIYAHGAGLDDIFIAQNGVFTYHIPDEDEEQVNQINDESFEQKDTLQDIISDDITEDTSGIPKYDPDTDIAENDSEYDLDDMYGYVLKGYAEYYDDEVNSVALDLAANEYLALCIKKPVVVEGKYFGYLQQTPSLFDHNYSKYNGTEYSIAPVSGSTSKSLGNFSAGTTYSQGIDYGELEQSSGIFTKYQYKNFAISTSYAKTVNTTNNNYNDNFYIIPELKLSQYLTIKNVLSADTVKKRKKAEVVLSLNPFGNKDYDRLRIELGASETYDEINNVFKNQLKFSTMYKF